MSDGNDLQNLQEIKIMQLHLWTSLLTNLDMKQFTNSCRNIQDIKPKGTELSDYWSSSMTQTFDLIILIIKTLRPFIQPG